MVKGELTFYAVPANSAGLIELVADTLGSGNALLAPIVQEYVVFEHFRDALYPFVLPKRVPERAIGKKEFPLGRYCPDIRVEVREVIPDNAVKSVIYAEYQYQSRSSYGHSDSADRRNDVNHIV